MISEHFKIHYRRPWTNSKGNDAFRFSFHFHLINDVAVQNNMCARLYVGNQLLNTSSYTTLLYDVSFYIFSRWRTYRRLRIPRCNSFEFQLYPRGRFITYGGKFIEAPPRLIFFVSTKNPVNDPYACISTPIIVYNIMLRSIVWEVMYENVERNLDVFIR